MSWSGDLNPCYANRCMTKQGSAVLWMGFSVFTASSLIILFIAHQRRRGHRTFHYLSAAILITASISYFVMASNLGNTPIETEFNRASPGETRSVFYARYVDWVITTPLLLLTLLLATGLPLSIIFFTLFIDIVMIVCGLISALIASRYKFGLFSIGCACLFYIYFILLVVGRRSASALGDGYGTAYYRGAYYLVLVWTIYPIIWGCSEGGNVISVTSEVIAYLVLDLLAKVVFTALHLYSIERLDYDLLGLSSGKWTDTTTVVDKNHSTRSQEISLKYLGNKENLPPSSPTAPSHSSAQGGPQPNQLERKTSGRVA
ncbi:hypothetical protein JCM5353_005495 [Sporobolomyces roseus]